MLGVVDSVLSRSSLASLNYRPALRRREALLSISMGSVGGMGVVALGMRGKSVFFIS